MNCLSSGQQKLVFVGSVTAYLPILFKKILLWYRNVVLTYFFEFVKLIFVYTCRCNTSEIHKSLIIISLIVTLSQDVKTNFWNRLQHKDKFIVGAPFNKSICNYMVLYLIMFFRILWYFFERLNSRY